ncbi:class I SAM-dependent methyltransferase [Humisphaera borealis]|uniref:Class I SAM-dependent methyltransferase n=1 Tax=Humisphaera borealis TaxID=2807512 RepID=A0A7M2WXL8_9BACT|nr:class I SAM-dependent methyltransferase [Humisphaera borealis]QOV90268.1 class I SAM-dependent methyltransferase [Humisphaera borealis]
MNARPSEALFREWDLYDRIVHDNWMAHREISAAIRSSIGRMEGPLKVLDLGSGDGEMAARSLSGSEISRYVAVDLSESALERLERRPHFGTQQACNRQIICRDMAAVVRDLDEASFDLVLASYSLHHFPTDQKGPLLDRIARLLRAGGCFIWTDSARHAGEALDDYLQRLTTALDSQWVSIPLADRRAAIEHVLTCDFPEQPRWMHEQLAMRGLNLAEEAYRDALFGTWIYVKSTQAGQ